MKPDVTRTYHTDTGVETTEGALDVHSVRYTIVTPIAIDGPSVEEIIVAKDTTTATIEIIYPTEKQTSDPPISGSFYVRAYDEAGTPCDMQEDLDFETSNSNF